MYTYPAHPLWPMHTPSDATVTISQDTRVTTVGIIHKLPTKCQGHTYSPNPTANNAMLITNRSIIDGNPSIVVR